MVLISLSLGARVTFSLVREPHHPGHLSGGTTEEEKAHDVILSVLELGNLFSGIIFRCWVGKLRRAGVSQVIN